MKAQCSITSPRSSPWTFDGSAAEVVIAAVAMVRVFVIARMVIEFVIRLILVPALMHLFGRASWWMPSALERRLPRLSIEGPQVATQER